MLDLKYKTFVGMHPIPIVYGMTLGEMAQMIRGEGWIKAPESLDIKIIPLQNYRHQKGIELPFPPSPTFLTLNPLPLSKSVSFGTYNS